MGGRPGFYAKDGTYLGGKSIGGKKGDQISKGVERWEKDVAVPREKLLDFLVPYVRGRGIQFLDQWLIQAVSAKGDAEMPPEESTDYWVVALIGNLIWAASCFVPGAGIFKALNQRSVDSLTGVVSGTINPGMAMTSLGKKLYATMALGGAVVGSGTVQQLVTDESGNPTGKDAVAMMLNKERKKLGGDFENSIDSFVREIVKHKDFQYDSYAADRINYLKAVDEALWRSIFPSIGYEDWNAIYQLSLAVINQMLINFKDQYKVWSQARKYYAMEPYKNKYNQYGPMLDNGEKYRARLKEYEKRRPFMPDLMRSSSEP
jgi:hypothetical protein